MQQSASYKMDLSKKIKQLCFDEGFDACGICEAKELTNQKENLQKWIDLEYNGTMKYMERNIDKRSNPALLFDNCKSIISLAINYFTPTIFTSENQYSISKYALGKDYHYIIKDKLHSIIKKITDTTGVESHRGFVDSAPVFERDLAVTAGLGWIGKNSCLILPKRGSFYFLAEIYTTLDLEFDAPFENNYCGNCTKCIDACPTNAIFEAGVVNSGKCISYLTIESKDIIPEELSKKYENQIFGCDICQNVCPWNIKFAHSPDYPAFSPSKDILNLSKTDWQTMSEDNFNDFFVKIKSPIARTGYEKMMENVKALKNNCH
jgi:epoxyqueuosine reductase